MLLLKDNLDLNKIMKYLERTVKHASNARKVLMELIEEYPSNTQVIRQLGILLKDIEHSDDEAELLFVQANAIEDSNSKSIHQQ
ncbi:MAG: hypothetical protein EZS28_016669 [Streblomastix strix]|uniref:TmcB/TmcC TPR repeats domain-containing protein n=1 Tax=Streblomastix strix TaxID=222440 RepID=A0A5J4VYQ8_9EUKA|nr:MAG: hypothetical protein EZS28_016669 [Streblomastix strix]